VNDAVYNADRLVVKQKEETCMAKQRRRTPAQPQATAAEYIQREVDVDAVRNTILLGAGDQLITLAKHMYAECGRGAVVLFYDTLNFRDTITFRYSALTDAVAANLREDTRFAQVHAMLESYNPQRAFVLIITAPSSEDATSCAIVSFTEVEHIKARALQVAARLRTQEAHEHRKKPANRRKVG
jgi:hypothetical protein